MNRRALSIADQVVSSASNGLLAVAVAQREDPEGFGAFGLAYGFVAIAIGIARAAVGEVVLIGSATQGVPTLGNLLRYGAVVGGATLLLGLAAAGLLEGKLAYYIAGCAIAACVVSIQDVFRFALFARKDYLAVLVTDCIWLALFVAAAAALLVGQSGGLAMVAGWGASALVSLLYAAWAFRRTGPGDAGYRLDRERARSNTFDQGGILVAGQGALALIAALAGLAPVGAIRAAQLLFTPASAATAGLRNIFLGEGSGPSRLWRWIATLCAVGAAWSVLVAILPRQLLVLALGETGAELGRVALAVLLAAEILRLVSTGLGDGLRTGGSHHLLIVGRSVFSLVLVASAAISAAIWNAVEPIAWARLAAFAIGVALWLVLLRGALRAPASTSEPR